MAPCRKWTMRWPVRIVSENLRCPRVSLTRKGIRNSHLLPRRRRASGNAGYHTGISSTCSFWSKISETLADCASSRCFNHLIQKHKNHCTLSIKSIPIGIQGFLCVTSSGWVTCCLFALPRLITVCAFLQIIWRVNLRARHCHSSSFSDFS